MIPNESLVNVKPAVEVNVPVTAASLTDAVAEAVN